MPVAFLVLIFQFPGAAGDLVIVDGDAAGIACPVTRGGDGEGSYIIDEEAVGAIHYHTVDGTGNRVYFDFLLAGCDNRTGAFTFQLELDGVVSGLREVERPLGSRRIDLWQRETAPGTPGAAIGEGMLDTFRIGGLEDNITGTVNLRKVEAHGIVIQRPYIDCA